MAKYSIFSLLRNAVSYHENWPEAWRSPDPKPSYDVIIVGGGGHGLATAYYLAKEHGITNVAVLEKGYLGGGGTGRNTTIVRSNYMWDESAALYEHALKLWEGLSQELNFNLLFSQRGIVNVVHSRHEYEALSRRIHSIRLNGVDSEMLTVAQLKQMVPILNTAPDARYPLRGGAVQRRGGIARHDAVAWGYARAADARGVDIIQNCEVTGIVREGGRAVGVETTRGVIKAPKIGIAVAGYASEIARMVDVRLPVQSYPLQAMVSEPLKPILDCVVMSGMVHVYVSQSDKGELVMGAGRDPYYSYGMRGSIPVIEDTISACVELFPIFSRVKLMRKWAGIVDSCPDFSPIIDKLPVEGMYINCGWGTGGFKSTPGSGWVYAHTIAQDRPHALNAPFSLERFSTGHFIDEAGAAGVH